MSPSACIEKESLASYLYGECPEPEQQRIERHLDACFSCAAEARDLQEVRSQLISWAPPESELGFRVPEDNTREVAAPWWRIPVWAQALAAVVVLMVVATAANLEIQYGREGWVVRTGWGTTNKTIAGSSAAPLATPWRPELAALEQQLRREFSLAASQSASSRVSAPQPLQAPAALNIGAGRADPETIRRVKALLDESERKQQSELALRLTQLYREMDVQRRADLLRIEENFGQIEGQTGAAIAQQREWLNHLVRASSQRR